MTSSIAADSSRCAPGGSIGAAADPIRLSATALAQCPHEAASRPSRWVHSDTDAMYAALVDLTYPDAIRGGYQTIIPTGFDFWMGVGRELRHRLGHSNRVGMFFHTARCLLLVAFDSNRHMAEWLAGGGRAGCS